MYNTKRTCRLKRQVLCIPYDSLGFPKEIPQAVAITSLFFTKYSTPEYSVVSVMTQQQTVLSTGGMGKNISTMHTMVEAVFTLPRTRCGKRKN